jgi:hypothetical protein
MQRADLQATSSWRGLRLRCRWDLLGLLVLLLAALPPELLVPKTLTVISNPGYMDDDWHLDSAFKASRDIWFGRDVVFTRGPLFQWISSLPARHMGVSTGSVYATWRTLPTSLVLVQLWLIVCLLLPQQPGWKRCLLLLLLSVFWSPSLRVTSVIFLFALFLRGGYAVAEMRMTSLLAGTFASLLCAAAFLLSTDTGIYGGATLLIIVLALGFEFRCDRQALTRLARAALMTAASSVVVVTVVNSALASPFSFQYWRNAFAVVGAYRWATPSPMTPSATVRLLATLIGGAAVFVVGSMVKAKSRTQVTARAGFFLSAGVVCLMLTQSAMVRSDENHVRAALLGVVLFSSVVLLAGEKLASIVGMLLVVGCSLGFGGLPKSRFASMELEEVAFAAPLVHNLVARLYKPITVCPEGFAEFDRACFPDDYTALQNSVAAFLQQHSDGRDSIAIFPYQTRYGLAARRTVAGGLLQAYTASGAYLSHLEIAGLQRAAPAAALYFPDPDPSQQLGTKFHRWRDTDRSLPVDGVANFTRAPEVWFWMQSHYRTEQVISPGVVGLVRDDARASRISLQTRSLGVSTTTFGVTSRSSEFDLGSAATASRADFLRLTLTVHYPRWWHLCKLQQMQLEVARADGSRDALHLVLPPNVATQIWVYPWNPSDLAHYFDADETAWRNPSRSGIVGLRLLSEPLDWASLRPDWIRVEAAEAITLSMANTSATGVAARGRQGMGFADRNRRMQLVHLRRLQQIAPIG